MTYEEFGQLLPLAAEAQKPRKGVRYLRQRVEVNDGLGGAGCGALTTHQGTRRILICDDSDLTVQAPSDKV